jgi:hypothetical protein
MEKGRDFFPKMELFPRAARAGRFIGRLLRFLPAQAPSHMSDHYNPISILHEAQEATEVHEQGRLFGEVIDFPEPEPPKAA